MNYIYDIALNFQTNYYQFFEWSRTDKIKNISKIPVYRISDEDIKIFIANQVKIDEFFLEQIKNDSPKKKNIICLVSNTSITLGLLFSNEGTLLKRSSLIFEEEDEVNDFAQTLPITPVKYLKNSPKKLCNKLRVEIEKKTLLIKYLTNTEDINSLKYLYYEYYGEECTDKDTIKSSLLKEIGKAWTQKQNNLYNSFNILTQNKELTK